MNQILSQHQDAIAVHCEQHCVQQLYAFGSVVRTDFDQYGESDLDFLVAIQPDLEPLERGEHLLQLWLELEQLLGRKVDLLTVESLKNPYMIASIERTKRLVYDRQHTEVPV